LRVVQDIVGFLTHLHQQINHVRIHLVKPAVLQIELIAQDQAQGVGRCHFNDLFQAFAGSFGGA
jgi:hypothetical protein